MNRQNPYRSRYARPAAGDGQIGAPLPVIGFSTPDINDRFLRFLESTIRVYADRNNLDYLIADAQNDPDEQYRQVRSLIENDHVQGLVVIPVDPNRMEPITAMARQAGVPLVYLNRQPFPLDKIPPDVYYVGSDPLDAGMKQGDFLAEHMGAGNLAILMGIKGLETTIRRTAGLEEELRRLGAPIQVIAREYANFMRAPAYQITKQWIAQFGNQLNAIAANNDEMALGAIQALREAGRDDVMVVGVDALAPGRAAVQQGLLAATVFQDATQQAELAMQMINQLIQGQTPAQQYILVPHILITPAQSQEPAAGRAVARI